METASVVPCILSCAGNTLSYRDVSDLNKKVYTKTLDEINGKRCLASMNGWFLMEDTSSKHCVLWSSITREIINLPPRDPNDVGEICHVGHVLLAPHTDLTDSLVMIEARFFFLFWKFGDEEWSKRSRQLLLNHQGDRIYSTVASTDGYIYAFTETQRVVIIGTDLSVRLCKFEIPPFNYREWICEHLVEFRGEIYLVALHYGGGRGSQTINQVEIFKLNFAEKVTWEKVESIGDLVFCLSEYTNPIAFSASELGMKANHIYVILYQDDILYDYSLEDDDLSAYDLNLPTSISPPFWWLMPKAMLKEKDPKSHCIIELPIDILHRIAMHLPFPTHCIKFRLVCKAFASSVRKIGWTNDPSESIIQYPWLMYTKGGHSRFSFLDPMYNVTHFLEMPDLRGAKIWFSKDGWLLMSLGGDRSILLFNPFSKVTIRLPDLPEQSLFRNLTFSASPTSSDCIVFGITYHYTAIFQVCFMHVGEDAWTCATHLLYDGEIRLSTCNPVFHHGAFYCLGCKGDMVIFEPKDSTGNFSIHFMPIPASSIHQSYLVESNGQLVSIFVGRRGQWVRAYRLDHNEMSWRPIDNLDDQMVFVSRPTSVSLKATTESMRNKIYFPLSFGKKNNCLFYSLETSKWHSAFEDYFMDDTGNAKEQLHCTWIQPTLIWNDTVI